MTMEKIAFVKTILNWFSTPSMGREIDADFLEDAYDEVTKPQWISVEDALPKMDEDVLILTPQNFVHIAAYKYRNWQTKAHVFVSGIDGYSWNNVTHWMPLPAPPVVSKTENTGKKSNFDENCEKYRTVFDGWEDLTFEERRDRINKFRSGQW